MSSLIKKMTVKKKKIAFTTGHGESETSQGFRALKQVLEQEYDLTTVNPSSAEIALTWTLWSSAAPSRPSTTRASAKLTAS